MTGDKRTTLVDLTTLPGAHDVIPIGLTADLDSQYLYWVDQNSSSIMKCAYDGSSVIVLYIGQIDSSRRAIALFNVRMLIYS